MSITSVRDSINVRAAIGLVAIPLATCLLVSLVGCANEPPPRPSPPNTPLPVVSQPAVVQSIDAPSSLEELILLSDTIARVTLLSASPHVIENPPGSYVGAIKFHFRVVEYLKGDGAAEIDVEVPQDALISTNDRQAAEVTAEVIFEARDRNWDSREAIVLLRSPQTGEASGASGATTAMAHRFAGPREEPVNIYEYAITSGYNRAWLPSVADLGGASGSSEIEYLTGLPGQTAGASGAAGAGEPSVTLSEINRLIGLYAALLSEGRDMPGYEFCLQQGLRDEAYARQGHFRPSQHVREILSGLPEGTRLWPEPEGYSGTAYYAEWWIGGPDSNLFEMRLIDDDDDPMTGYSWEEVAIRPIPRGTYKIFYNNQPAIFIPCNYRRPWAYDRREATVTVSALPGILHEAFFDPVAIGEAVGSDADSGVLDPASFTLEGAGSVNIDRIEWQSSLVEVELDPHTVTGFANHHVDFIALDGTKALRLDFDDAVEVERDGTRALAWSVCDQPWEGGDLLMLRMRTSSSDLTDVTNDSPCSPPQNLVATSTHGSVTLAWDRPEDPTVTGYRMLRRPSGQETFTQFDVDGAATTTYVDSSDIQPATNYIYRVHAVNAAGISEMARVAVRTLAPPPQNLVATSTHESVTLTWDAPDGDTGTGYRIYRREPGQETFVQFEVSGAATTSYVDTSNVQASTRYIYRVHTVYSAGLSDVARVTVTTSSAP